MGKELTYKDWKDYINTDENKEMKKNWKSLISLSESKRKELADSLKNKDPHLTKEQISKKIKEEQDKISEEIFNTLRDRPCDFEWEYRGGRDARIGNNIRTIRIFDSKSRYTLQRIKELRWVSSLHWTSINKYFTVANKIKERKNEALQEATDTSYRISLVNNSWNSGDWNDDWNGGGERRKNYEIY